jgi:gpW
MASCEQKQAWLADAENAFHLLNTGAREVLISTGSKEIRYAPANIGSLAQYVNSLRNQVAACTGVPCYQVRHIIHLTPEDSGTRRRGW